MMGLRSSFRRRISARLRISLPLVALFTGVVYFGASLVPRAQVQTYRVLYSFAGGMDGQYPEASLIRDAAGNLYGTTLQGGEHGLGTVFEISPN